MCERKDRRKGGRTEVAFPRFPKLIARKRWKKVSLATGRLTDRLADWPTGRLTDRLTDAFPLSPPRQVAACLTFLRKTHQLQKATAHFDIKTQGHIVYKARA